MSRRRLVMPTSDSRLGDDEDSGSKAAKIAGCRPSRVPNSLEMLSAFLRFLASELDGS